MAGDAGEDVIEPGEGIDVNALAGSHETAQHCGRPSADIAPEKHPVATTHRHAADGALGTVIVDLQISVLAIAR